MDPTRFRRLCAGLHRLSPRQLSELESRLAGLGARTETLAALDRRAAEIRACPRCRAEALGRWGVDRRGLQRLRCRACGRTCSAATGSPLAGLRRPEAFREVLHDMVSAVRPAPCRRLAERLGVDKTTVWRWRMRILAGLASHRRASVDVARFGKAPKHSPLDRRGGPRDLQGNVNVVARVEGRAWPALG